MDMKIQGNKGINLELIKKNLPAMLCPSDAEATVPLVTELSEAVYAGTATAVALTCYAANSGDHINVTGTGYSPPYANDTYAIGGSTVGSNKFGPLRGVISRFACSASMRDIKDGTSSTFLFGEVVPSWCYWQAWGLQSWATTSHPLNYQNYLGSSMHTNADVCVGFRSLHANGANFAICDGSVTFILDTIDYTVYRALASRDGGETSQVP
jgi:prepilin-type processing-associated H-X9-DG protein